MRTDSLSSQVKVPGRRLGLRPTRTTAVLWALIALAFVPAQAQDGTSPPGATGTAISTQPAADAESPVTTFLIEKLVVEGVKHGSERIVAAETLLKPGESYTEPQLQQALHRVERLPFVVQAEFSLRKGSERGRHELLIGVTEATPVFYGTGLDFSREGGCCGREGWTSDGHGPGLGARLFVAGQNELTAGLGGFGYSRLQGAFVDWNAAYTRHNLFGRSVAASVVAGTRGTGLELGAQLAIPLSRAKLFRLIAERRRADRDWSGREYESYAYLGPSRWRQEFDQVGASWQHDSTDDPFVPARGTRVGVSLAVSESKEDHASPLGFGPWGSAASHWTSVAEEERRVSGSVLASRYRPLSRKVALGVELGLSASLARIEGSSAEGDARGFFTATDRSGDASLAVLLLGRFPERRRGRTQYWWSLGMRLSDRALERDCGGDEGCTDLPRLAESERAGRYPRHQWGDSYRRYGGNDLRETRATLSASIAARGRWGTVSLAFHYRHYLNDRMGW